MTPIHRAGDKIKNNEMGGTFRMHRRERMGVYRVWLERSVEKHLETLRIDGKIILKCVFKKRDAKERTRFL